MKSIIALSALAFGFITPTFAAATGKFNTLCYLNRYPDVNKKNWAGTARDHWLMFGKKEGRIPDCSGLDPGKLNRAILNKVSIVGGGSNPIKLTVNNDYFAGAVSGIKWNKKSFINIRDHGRELQTAFQVDGYGECNNPTEAGGSKDVDNGGSSSRLISVTTPYTNRIKTSSQMAYWVYDRTTGSCKKGPDPIVKSPRSKHIINKDITIGYNGDDQIIKYNVNLQLDLETIRDGASYEFLTGYLTPEFKVYHYVNSANKMLIKVPADQYRQLKGNGFPDSGSYLASPTGKDKFDPIVLSNKKGTHAMGVYVPKSSIDKCMTNFHGYSVYKFALGGSGPLADGANKWSVSLNERKDAKCVVGNQRNFEVFLVVGTLSQVHEKLLKLLAQASQ